MFLRGKLCQNKTLFICLFLAFCLSCLFSVFSSSPANATSLSISSLQLRYLPSSSGSASWSDPMYFGNPYLLNGAYWYNIDAYQWNSSVVNVTGNYANIHFETNIVLSEAQASAWHSGFVNLDYLHIIGCSASGSGSLSIRQQAVSSLITDWVGPAPSITYKNKTLTVYADLVISGLSNGTQNIYCMVGGAPFAFAQTSSQSSSSLIWFEKQPTTITFTTDETDALARAQIDAINSLNSSIASSGQSIVNAINNQESDYDKEKADLEDKESEVEGDASDLSLSATVPANPLFRFFKNPFGDANQRCYTTISIHNMFNSSSAWNICSPFPSQARQYVSAATNFFLLALILRLYFKKLKGGVDG